MSSTAGTQILEDAYSLMAELWCAPPEENAEREKIRKDAEKVIERL